MTPSGNPPLPLALARLLETTSDAVFTLDRDGRLTYINPKAAAIASLTPQEVIGLHLERDLPHVFSTRWLTESRRALAQECPVEYDAFNPALGEWVRVYIVPTPAGLAVQIRNVTTARRARALQEVTTALSQALTSAQVADVLLTQAVTAASAYMGALFVPGGNGTHLELRGQVGYSPELLERFAHLPLSLDLPLCDAARRREPVFVSGDALEQAYPDTAGLRAERTRSLAALPLSVDGGLWGVLVLSYEESRRFRADEREFVQSLVEQCAQALGRTRTEAELRTRQAQLRVVLETAGLGHWELDLRTHETRRTPRHDEIFGYAEGHPLWTYETFLDHVLPEERAAVDRNYRTALERGEPWDFECRVRRTDGEVRWIWARGQVLPEGEASGDHMLGLVQDITARKQAEEQLRVQADTLETVNRIGRSLSAELDLDRLVQAVTDAGVELTGAQFGAFFYNVENEQQETYTLYTLSGVPREAFASFPMPRNTQIFGPTFAGEGVIRSPDITQDPRYGRNAPYAGMPAGHLPVRSYLAVPVISRGGEVLGGLFFGHAQPDVFSERAEQVTLGLASQTAVALDNARLYQQLQHSHAALERRVEERTRQLEEQARELRRSNAELEQFAYIASHDLQAPIRAVTSFAGLIAHRYGGQLDERGQRYLEQIVGNGEHMKRLVDDLLAFSRLHTQQRGPQATSSAAALRDVLRRLRPDLELLGARITPGPLPTVLADAQQLDQLFQNLISNALKYRREDVSPCVSVTAERDGQFWRFAVVDNGIGIEAQYHERIFVIFQRLHGREKYEGTGIGLAVCKKIVERHGGRLWLESTPGEGSTFYFTLPDA